jgi:hypothetical protein
LKKKKLKFEVKNERKKNYFVRVGDVLRARVSVVCVYVCDENNFLIIFFFLVRLIFLLLDCWESFIVWIVRITHLVFHFYSFCILFFFYFYGSSCSPNHLYTHHTGILTITNQTKHNPPTTSRAVPDFIEFLRKLNKHPKPPQTQQQQQKTNPILIGGVKNKIVWNWIDRRAVGLSTMGAMSVTVSLNTNGVGLDSTLSTIAAPAAAGPPPGSTPITNGSSPTNNQTTIGAVTSSPATVATAPAAAAAAAAITSAAANNNAGGVLSPVRVDL